MRYLLLPLLLTGCTTIGTVSNPACLVFCKENSNTTITTHKEMQNEIPVPARRADR